MRNWGIAAAAALAMASTAAAQQPFVNKPIDTSKAIVQPTNAVANVAGAATAGTISTLGATIANTIENNGFVRTFNNLLGRRASPPSTQLGYSALPPAGSYQSLKYPNTFQPRMPIQSTFGSSVTFPKER